MTIAAGFITSDGVVLAADSFYTGANKRNAAKLWCFPQPPVGTSSVVALAGAGDRVLIHKTRDEIQRLFKPSMNEHDIVQMVEDILYPLYVKNIMPDTSGDTQLEVLIGIRTMTGCVLYWNDGTACLAKVDTSQCIGCGRSLGTYLSEWLFTEGMPIRFVRTVAAHLLKLTKTHADNCGGASQIVLIPTVGEPHRVDQSTIGELERQLGDIEAAMRKVLVFSPGVPGVDFNAETLAERTKALGAAVAAARGLYVQITGVAAMGAIGNPMSVVSQGESSTSSLDAGESVRISDQIVVEKTEMPSLPDTSGKTPEQ